MPTIVLDTPYPKQREIIYDPARFKVICSGRRVGKTVLCRIITLIELFKGKKVCYITPEYGLAEKVFTDIVSQLLPTPTVIVKQNKSRLQLVVKGGGELNFFSGEALHRVRGYEYDLLIIDEAAQIPSLQSEWELSLRPLLLKSKGGAIFVSTPFGKNYFYSLFQKGLNGEDGFKSWQFSSHYNPHLDPTELEFFHSTLSTVAYNQEILAEPGENQFNPFGTDNIRNITTNNLSTNPSVCYGVDFGRVNDWTVIIGQDKDGNMSYFDRFKLPWEQTIQRVQKLRSIDPYTLIVVDSGGVGSVLLERLQTTIPNVIGFEFTGTSKPIIIKDLILDVEANRISVNDITAQEMNTYEYKITSMGNVKYEAQSGYHDDCIAALSICNNYRKKYSGGDHTVYFF